MKPLVIYHGACRDGFCAAWCVWRKFPEAEFIPAMYGNPPPNVDDRLVIVVDFSYDRALMDEMSNRATSLIVLDHHKTAEDALRGAPYAKFDMNRSGAGMAWDHFFPGISRPWTVNYIEDRDLWRFALPHSKAINAWLSVVPFEFSEWEKETLKHPTEAKQAGEAIEAKTNNYVREVAKNACRTTFHGHNVPIVNAPQVDISELVGFLCNGEKFAMGWWQRSDGKFSVSLRSRGDFDVSELAKLHGGGGHKNAAGFLTEYMPLTGVPFHG